MRIGDLLTKNLNRMTPILKAEEVISQGNE
jgi:hypothetical protein